MQNSQWSSIYCRRDGSTIGHRGLSAAASAGFTSTKASSSMPLAVKANFKDGTDGPSTCVTRR
jgi:hypothetical protein